MSNSARLPCAPSSRAAGCSRRAASRANSRSGKAAGSTSCAATCSTWPPADLGNIAAIFDRASLTALPEEIRHAYLAHLRKIVPAASKILLLTTEEPEADETQGQPFAIADEISSLYALAYDIDLSHVESVFEADADPGIKELVRVEHKVYLLTPK